MSKTICENQRVDETWDYCFLHPFMKGFTVPVLSLPGCVAEYGRQLTTLGAHVKGHDRFALSQKVYGVPMHYAIRIWPK